MTQDDVQLLEEAKSTKGAGVRTIKTKTTPQIEFDPDTKQLVVRRTVGKHLVKMGRPFAKGIELQPEEAVYMVENATAYITIRGKPLTLAETYHHILAKCKVPFHEYSIYSVLKKHGFVVKRCHPGPKTEEKAASTSENGEPTSPPSTPVDDKWPNLATGVGLSLRPDALGHLTAQADNRLITYQGPTSSLRSHLHRRPCRPLWMPPLDELKSCEDWNTYRKKRQQVMEKSRREQQQREKEFTASPPGTQFDVFVAVTYTHSYPGRPIFRVKCHNLASGPLELLSADPGPLDRLIIGIFDNGMINFIECSGEPVDLASIQ